MRSPSPALRVITAYAAALLVGVGLNLHDGPAKAGPYLPDGLAKADHSLQPSAPSPQPAGPYVPTAALKGGPTSPASPGEVLGKYCVTCHNSRLKTAGLMLDTLDVEHVAGDRKSTRLNSSHTVISYAVFCLKKKKKTKKNKTTAQTTT